MLLSFTSIDIVIILMLIAIISFFCLLFNISKIIFLTLSDARMCVPVYILIFSHRLLYLPPELRETNVSRFFFSSSFSAK